MTVSITTWPSSLALFALCTALCACVCTGDILRDNEYLRHYLQLFNKSEFIFLSNPTKAAGSASQLLRQR